jgi:hypothetical protein
MQLLRLASAVDSFAQAEDGDEGRGQRVGPPQSDRRVEHQRNEYPRREAAIEEGHRGLGSQRLAFCGACHGSLQMCETKHDNRGHCEIGDAQRR